MIIYKLNEVVGIRHYSAYMKKMLNTRRCHARSLDQLESEPSCANKLHNRIYFILDERKTIETRKAIDAATTHNLKKVNIEEYEFWEHLKNKCLLPSSTAFGLEEDLKSM